jgi:hypothetical protein
MSLVRGDPLPRLQPLPGRFLAALRYSQRHTQIAGIMLAPNHITTGREVAKRAAEFRPEQGLVPMTSKETPFILVSASELVLV